MTEQVADSEPLLSTKGGARLLSVAPSADGTVEDGRGRSTSTSSAASNEGFSFWVAAAFTVNYIMGCGFLGMPSAFASSGLVLGPIVVVVFGLIMNVTKDFMLEAMARAEALVHLPARTAQVIAAKQPGSAILSAAGSKHDDGHDYLVYVTILSGYMYGALWAYSTVFAASFSANVPIPFLNNGNTCNVEEDGSACFAPFMTWLGVFAVTAVPLSCLELKEQVYVQVIMFLARLLVVLMMTGTALAGYGCHDGVVFADMGTSHGPDASTPLFSFSGLAIIMPVSIYAFIFHHSVPVLSQPVANKRSLPRVFMAAFLIVGSAYAALGLILAAWFGKDHVDGQCNLNWRQYVGCMADPGPGKTINLDDRPLAAKIVSFVILIFPALDVLSAYPLNAITLGNNLLSATYGNQQGSVHEHGDGHAHEGDGSSSSSSRGSGSACGCLRLSPTARRRIAFRLIAAVPPVAAGAASTYAGLNLTQILSFTGLIGVAIAFGIPSLLRAWAFTRHRAVLQGVAAGIDAHWHDAKHGNDGGGDRGGDGDDAVVAAADRIVHDAMTAIVPAKAIFEASEDDAAVASTPYTNVVLRVGRCDKALFVFAIGIAIFVLTGLILGW